MERKTGQNSLLGELTPEKKSGLVYSAAVAASLLLSFAFVIGILAADFSSPEEYESADWYLYLSFLASPLGFAAVAAIYFVRTKESVKAAVGVCKPRYYLLAVLLQIGLLSLSELNNLFISFLERFGYVPSEVRIPSLDGGGLFGVLLVVAVLPALMEELIFRGLLLKGLKSFGTAAAVLLCGALFSLYHQNPVQTAYQFVCGAAFAFVALRAGSILPTVLSHFLNNAAIILLAKFGYEEMPSAAALPVIVVSVLCLAASLVWLFLDGRRGAGAKERDGNPAEKTEKEREKPDKKGFFLCAAAGIAVCAVVWLSGLFAGFGG